MIDLRLSKKEAKSAKPANRKQASRKIKRSFRLPEWDLRIVGSLLIPMLLALVVMLAPADGFLPIEKIRISGQFKHLDSRQIEQQLKPFLGIGFFSVDIEKIQRSIQRQSWVSKVSVRRIWPNMLSISVVERQPFARWDKQHLLSVDGQVFAADSGAFEHLPLINGYAGQSRELLQRFVALRRQLGERSINLSELSEDSKGAMRLILDNKLSVSLGSENIEQKVRHMLAVYRQQIRVREAYIDHIDFRYSNGFSITWKEEYLKQKNDLLSRGSKNV